MTEKEFSNRLARRVGLTQPVTRNVFREGLKLLQEILFEGDHLVLKGFGTFRLVKYPETSHVSGLTNKRYIFPEHDILRFIVSPTFKARLRRTERERRQRAGK